MAEPRWKRAAGAHLAPAQANSTRARQHLAAALRDLRSDQLLHTRDDAGRYIRLESAAHYVEEASWLLTLSMAGMLAAEFLYLRGYGPLPTHPVATIDDLRDDVDAQRGLGLALARLRTARAHGQQALRATEAAYGHLGAARFMATHLPPAVDLHAVMQDQVNAADNQIHQVMGGMETMSFLINCAANRIHFQSL